DNPLQIVEGGRSSALSASRPVLVVDDDPDTVNVVSRMLESLGIPHRSASSGEEAIRQVRAAEPALVLMDVALPDLDGCTVTRDLLRATGREHLPIVAMTALTSPEDQSRCHEAGCIDFLAKPIERSDLERILSRWIRLPVQPVEERTGPRRAAG
ncbi:MAG: response regulator, partial [Candidatus Eisenbacteria bacterium]|nr:response regulator [Candidatus Latescibacterota bacterium]MBD3301672.1 response regulator [Candidatus Eisenbacteria bacterium]